MPGPARQALPATETDQKPSAPRPTASRPSTVLAIATGLRRIGHNEAIYFDLLQKFHDQYADTADGLRRLLAGPEVKAEKRVEARRLAHTLKGLAASLGTNTLADAARQLEEQLVARENCSERIAGLESELSLVLAAIERLRPQDPPAPRPIAASAPSADAHPLPDHEVLEALVREAARLLRAFDADVETPVVRLHAALVGTAWAAQANPLKDRAGPRARASATA